MGQRNRAGGVAFVRLVLRWLTYNSVGLMGTGVQLITLFALRELGEVDLRLATALAVETAILHNFVWHERWTWRDRLVDARRGRWQRLARFNLVSGTVSITGNVVLTAIYVSNLGLHYGVANVLAVASVSLLNFVVNDRLVFHEKKNTTMKLPAPVSSAQRIVAIACGVMLVGANPQAAELTTRNDRRLVTLHPADRDARPRGVGVA